MLSKKNVKAAIRLKLHIYTIHRSVFLLYKHLFDKLKQRF